jgi:hypothetical protein
MLCHLCRLSCILCRKLALYAECHFAQCHYAVCRHAECRGAVLTECIEFLLENIQIRNRMGDGKIRQFFVNHVNEPEKRKYFTREY